MSKLTRKWHLDYKELDGFIARMRRQNVSPSDIQSDEEGTFDFAFGSAYIEYEAVRAQEGWMDFDSMLHDAVEMLENEQTRSRWQVRYLIVDEAQDTDDLQWRLMQLMSERHGNITVVGDPGQAIYGFRGAKPDNITNFRQWFPNGRSLYLGRNYRSTRAVVKFTRENVPDGTPKELIERMQAARDIEGARVGLKMYRTDNDEAESALKLSQRDPLNSVILARTNRMVGLLERICQRHNVRYHLLGKSGFWKQNEIRRAVDALKEYPTMTTAAALNLALPTLEAKYAVDDRTERDNDALENLKTLREIGKDFQMAKEFAVHANKMMHRRNDPRGVSISTVHQAKGGEWKNVYVIGVNAKGFPHVKGDALEEKRIYYVAVSRAVDYLRISFAGTPSPYLRRYITTEILDKLLEHAGEVDRLQEQATLFA